MERFIPSADVTIGNDICIFGQIQRQSVRTPRIERQHVTTDELSHIPEWNARFSKDNSHRKLPRGEAICG
ncbi:hypothetical protein WJ32_18570 (plasmid) [Burkholderia ubonensis]|uniref:Uncharacterized protein n=1 Tax=Burkholderia ubonensis TaxID=101571 RepID=A0A103RP15_9BURK|nr:hypothetical protein WJ32_18570 [Burkholderia ubonensis]KVG71128.1 hypothetical protein WJ33_21290 [Burkholderia ubonensis]